jgi:hypothetical protein
MMKGSYNYSSAWHAISSIVRQRGLHGMLKGYWAGNSVRPQRLMSWCADMVCTREACHHPV